MSLLNFNKPKLSPVKFLPKSVFVDKVTTGCISAKSFCSKYNFAIGPLNLYGLVLILLLYTNLLS